MKKLFTLLTIALSASFSYAQYTLDATSNLAVYDEGTENVARASIRMTNSGNEELAINYEILNAADVPANHTFEFCDLENCITYLPTGSQVNTLYLNYSGKFKFDVYTSDVPQDFDLKIAISYAGNGTLAPQNDTITFLMRKAPTSVQSVENAFNVTVGPNPFNEYVSINSTNGPVDFKMLDLTGKVVAQGSTANQQPNINVSELPKGIYLMTVTNGSYSETKKLVKQ